MDGILQLLCVLTLLCIVVGFLKYYKRRWPVTNFPPGPTGMPSIGTYFSTRNTLVLKQIVNAFVPRYGKVFSLMQDFPLVIVTGYDAINEVFQSNKGHNFASRKENGLIYIIHLHNPKKLGVFFPNYSDRWQRQKRFALTTLRGFGFGKRSFEEKIAREVKLLLNHLKYLAQVPHDLSSLLIASVARVMCDTILGCHYDDNSTEFQHALRTLQTIFRMYGLPKSKLLNYVPFSRPFLKHHAQTIVDLNEELYAFLMSKVAEHQRTLDAGGEPRDFVDCYLKKRLEEPDTFTLEDLKYVLSDLFAASTETTTNTLRFALLYMMVNPDVQRKVHEETLRVAGSSRLPCLEDQDKMPYTVATIYEVQRLSTVAPVVNRSATIDTTLAGFSIPKGTNVVCDMWGLHHDPELWPEPERFDPTRHLNEKGQVFKSPHLLPFGAGRRVCMGETLARMELFLFFSSLLHQYQFQLPPDCKTPRLDPAPGITSSPHPYQVIIKECDVELAVKC